MDRLTERLRIYRAPTILGLSGSAFVSGLAAAGDRSAKGTTGFDAYAYWPSLLSTHTPRRS